MRAALLLASYAPELYVKSSNEFNYEGVRLFSQSKYKITIT